MRLIIASSLLSLTYFTCAVAENKATPVAQRPFTSSNTPAKPCNPGPNSRAAIGYRGPKGLGYDHGYATLSTFISPSGERVFQPFIDLRGHVFNDGKLAANAGLGGRYAFDKAILGLNAYYDFRDTKQLGGQNQVGGGLELLSKWVDFRMNGYVPLGNTTGKECPCFDHFACNSAFARQVVRASLADIDAEVGFYIPKLKVVDLYFAIGPYYLFEKTVCDYSLGGEWGGRARVSLKVYDGITLGGDVTYDPIFNTKGQGWITLSFPFGPANLRQYGSRLENNYPTPCDETARQVARMTQPVYRNEIIPVENKTRIFNINCECCCPSQIYFVNNCNCDAGCGTYENPFNTLIAAEATACPGDTIYVFPGDGTSTGMDCGFIMKDNQKLIGSATSFELCDICIPACTPGCYPLIENTHRTTTVEALDDVLANIKVKVNAGYGVQMANCTEVAGFCFSGDLMPENTTLSVGALISKGSTFTIRDNFFTNQRGGAIFRDKALSNGCITISNNCISDIKPFVGTGSSASFGVFFLEDVNNTDVTFCNNTIRNLFVDSQGDGIDSITAGVSFFGATNLNLRCTGSTFTNFSASAMGLNAQALLLGLNVGSGGGAGDININLIKNCAISCFNTSFSDFNATTQGVDSVAANLGIGVGSGITTETAIEGSTLCVSNSSFNNLSTTSNGLGVVGASFGVGFGAGVTINENATITDCQISCRNSCFTDFKGNTVGDVGIASIPITGILGIAYGSGSQVSGKITNSTLSCFDSTFKNFTAENIGPASFSGIFALATGGGVSVGPTATITNSPITCCNTSFTNFTSSSGQLTGIFGVSNGSGAGIGGNVISNSPITCTNCTFNNFNSSISQSALPASSVALICGIGSSSAGIMQGNEIINSLVTCTNSSFNKFNAEGVGYAGIFGIGIGSGAGIIVPLAPNLDNASLSCCNSSFTNFNATAPNSQVFGIAEVAGLAITAAATLDNSTLFVCNNRFDQLQATEAFDIEVFANNNNTLCIERNRLFTLFDANIRTGSSCLRLTGNQNQGNYQIAQTMPGVWNVESPDLANLTAGLQSINQGTFALVEGTPVPVGSCDCTACCPCR